MLLSSNMFIMRFLRPVLAGMVGASWMTAFSYWYSRKKKVQFREPILINQLVEGLFPSFDPNRNKNWLAGWILHYCTGIFFSFCYVFLLDIRNVKPSTTKRLIVGGINGIVGILVWKTIFAFHPKPPKIPHKQYYFHLLLAHLIFGYFALEKEKQIAVEHRHTARATETLLNDVQAWPCVL